MITIDLQARFNVQARADHLRRMHFLLTSLDLYQSYSLKPDFTESLSAAIDLLEAHDVTQAYSQACVLLSLFAGQVSIHGISSETDPQTNVFLASSRLKLNANSQRTCLIARNFRWLTAHLNGGQQVDQIDLQLPAWPRLIESPETGQ